MPLPTSTSASKIVSELTNLFATPALAAAGYKVFDAQHPYDLTLVGIRNPSDDADAFDDTMLCLFRDASLAWQLRAWRITTDPGKEALAAPMRRAGTAIVAPGVYRGCWTAGIHNTKYRALVQAKAGVFRGWRDPNKDMRLDRTGPIYNDLAGINAHKSGSPQSERVGPWSAGCQVHATEAGFREMMSLYDLQVKHHPSATTVSYALLDAGDYPALAAYLP